jgi:glycosyltransferase involved in cell wall biosynthesis
MLANLLAEACEQSGSIRPLRAGIFRANGHVDVARWIETCGVRSDQHLDVGQVPNYGMPPLLREVDCAVFPNRCEGGTNLVAMECMACGVPTILSANTGHLDLIQDDTVFALEEQRPGRDREASIDDVPGWGESSVDEVVEALE